MIVHTRGLAADNFIDPDRGEFLVLNKGDAFAIELPEMGAIVPVFEKSTKNKHLRAVHRRILLSRYISAMKINRHGQVKILSIDEITRLFQEGLTTDRDRALFGICFFTGCRISESCSLFTEDVYGASGSVRAKLTLRKGNTKGKLKTRSIPVRPELMTLLKTHHLQAGHRYLFPGRWRRGHIHPDSAALILRAAFERLAIEGASTHSFRRTALTRLSNAGVPLRVIQEISGHETLAALQKYLEVTERQVEDATAAL